MIGYLETRLHPLVLPLLTAILLPRCAERQQPQSETAVPLESDTAPAGEQPAVRERQPIPKSGTVAEPINSPWRNAGEWHKMNVHTYFSPYNLWDWAPERYRLAQVAEQLPDGIEGARAHLRLARIGPNYSLWARQHVLAARPILAELIARAPETPGLLKAVVDANRSYQQYHIDDETGFYRIAHDFIEQRWQGDAVDAAEAGYRLNQILAVGTKYVEIEAEYRTRLDLLDKVINHYPDSDWALQAEFEQIGIHEKLDSWHSNDPGDDSRLREYVAFADEHAGHPLAARALLSAAQSYGFGEYGQAQHGGLANVPRLERAMELQVRYQREYPEGAPRDPDVWHTQPEPSIQLWGEPDADADTTRLEQLAHEYYALNPRGATTLITTFAPLKRQRTDPLPLTALPVFYRQFWDRVEELAEPAMQPDVRLARAWFFTEGEPYSTQEYRRKQLQESSAILEQVCKDFPQTDAAAVALDALALLAIRLEEPQQALAYWDKLAAQFPEHSLNRPAAVDRLFVEHPDRTGALWRLALRELQQRFPDDPLIALATRCLRAQSLQRDGAIAAARGDFEAAQDPWTAVFPLDRIGIASQTISLGPLHDVRAGLFQRIGLADDEPPTADLRFLSKQSMQTPEERLAVYAELLELFPDSPNFVLHSFSLAHAQLETGRLAEAQETFQHIADDERTDPDTRLMARAFSIRLDYQLAESPSADDAAAQLRAALQEHARAAAIEEPRDPRGIDVASLYHHAYAHRKYRRELSETLVSRNAANLWYVVTGSDPIEVEFHDGLLLNYVMTPPLPAAIANRAIRLADPASILNALGVGDPQAAGFIDHVVDSVFVMNTEANRELADPAGQQFRFPRDDNAAPPPPGPLIVTQPPEFASFVFYDAQRTQAEVHPVPHTDVSETLFYARRDGAWESSDGREWFLWGRR